MLFLQFEDPKADIHLYINSPGGSVTAGHEHLRHDALRHLRRGDLLHRPGGQHGGRRCWPPAPRASATPCRTREVMIHQPLGGIRGTATDILIRTKHLLRTKKMMNEILAEHTGQPLERIEKDTDRDNFMNRPGGEGIRPGRRRLDTRAVSDPGFAGRHQRCRSGRARPRRAAHRAGRQRPRAVPTYATSNATRRTHARSVALPLLRPSSSARRLPQQHCRRIESECGAARKTVRTLKEEVDRLGSTNAALTRRTRRPSRRPRPRRNHPQAQRTLPGAPLVIGRQTGGRNDDAVARRRADRHHRAARLRRPGDQGARRADHRRHRDAARGREPAAAALRDHSRPAALYLAERPVQHGLPPVAAVQALADERAAARRGALPHDERPRVRGGQGRGGASRAQSMAGPRRAGPTPPAGLLPKPDLVPETKPRRTGSSRRRRPCPTRPRRPRRRRRRRSHRRKRTAGRS